MTKRQFQAALQRIAAKVGMEPGHADRDAAARLGHLRSPSELLELLSAADAPDAAAAAWALGEIRVVGAAERLTDVVGDQSRDEEVRWRSARALWAYIGADPRADSALADRLTREREPTTLHMLVHAAWLAHGSEVTTALLSILEDTSIDGYVRGAAAECLHTDQRDDVCEALLRHLASADPEVRLNCAYGLGQLGDAKAVDALRQLVSDRSVCRDGECVGDMAEVAIRWIVDGADAAVVLGPAGWRPV